MKRPRSLIEEEMVEIDEVQINASFPDHRVRIGAQLEPELREKLINFLSDYYDCFAWSHEDMTGIDPKIIVHRLQVAPEYPPRKQKRRKFAPERNQVVNDEFTKLLKNGLIREVHYPEWLANVVVVKKKNNKWRVCIDFTDLNKACPKDSFPLPHIDMLVDATAGHELMSFMDAYSGYHQIRMHPDDEEKTTFMTNIALYCYKYMPFGLKNAGATYQRLVNQMFASLLRQTMEVYIDDMLVKSIHAKDHIDHLRETFEILRKYNMKLNPTKCSFGVNAGKFLGYMVTQRGIEANPAQIESIQGIPSPTCVKDKSRTFEWTEECEEALKQLKQYLTSPPLLAKLKDHETLLVYLAVSDTAVSVVLVREEDGKQSPIYYVSKSLLDAETRYSQLEKLALALVHAARKLRPYFQCHPIIVATTYPLKAILHKPELSDRLTKWAVELSEYDITYKPRTALKSQVLADFVVDFAPNLTIQADKELCCLTEEPDQTGTWKLYVDGSSNVRGSGLGIVLSSPRGDNIERSIRCNFKTTNNEAEYEAMLSGLGLAKEIGVKRINVFSDSQLVVNQMQGTFQAKDTKMTAYLGKTKELQSCFEEFTINQVPRGRMVMLMLWPTWAIQKDEAKEQVTEVSVERTWMTPIMEYLEKDILPDDRNEARRLKAQAAWFCIIRGKLYKRSFTGPYLKCINPAEARYVLSELHEGECDNHSGGRSLAHRAITNGYYWPTMKADAADYARKCDKCQRFAQISHLPPEPMTAITSPWPFMKWGMDIVGKLPTAPGQKVYMLAVTDYFSKWIEADSFHQVRDKEVKGFIWKNVICRYGVPKEIVTDNGSQFISADFQDFCKFWNIKLSFSTPRYPQANGQAAFSNKTIMNTLKKRLEKAKGKWADELPGVLWSYRTTTRTSTGETPFSLAYGMEAVIPTESEVPTARYELTTDNENQEAMCHELDLLDEKRNTANIRLASYQQSIARHYNKHICTRTFKPGDWVFRKVFQNTKEIGAGKLAPNWEGPYLITKVVGHGAYRLQSTDGRDINNSWNAIHLKQYHA
ncbi:uncharacterized protein LOC131018411 [Salvia miltiorrhiza]|uniref:uncharacterized protein LOC131018411 n=1 Tax=Salvia miltiorrhiza TaxID=226208 RepID=UPI0025ACF135|nr:uncharacterized protein LOC131018411 [Salvia miltiorrhiza]